MMCPLAGDARCDWLMSVGIQIVLLAWVIFVPIVITNRLEKIIKLLEKK